MLTAKGDDMDKILGLEYGADDYMTKPFNILEVKARIKGIFRRTAMMQKENTQRVITVRDMQINLNNRSVVIGGREVNLTAKEFDLLQLFVTNRGKVFSRESLLETIWKYDYLGDLRTVDVHIRRPVSYTHLDVYKRQLQVQPADDGRGAQIEGLFDDLRQLVVRQRAGALAVHEHAHGPSHADGVGNAHLAAAAEAGGDEVFGHVAQGVGGGAIHLAGVFSGKSAAAVPRVAAVAVDDDLAAGKAGIALRPAHHEAAGGVDEELGVLVEPVSYTHLQDGL